MSPAGNAQLQSVIVRRVMQRVTAVTKNYSFNSNGECQQEQLSESESKKRDAGLTEKFQYFRQQFMDASIAAGVTVPLDFFDDKSGRLFNFMLTQTGQCGPKYVLSVVESNPESTHLVRCSLSLLIVTVQLLRRKLPHNGIIVTPFLAGNSPKGVSSGGAPFFPPTGASAAIRAPPAQSVDLNNVNAAMSNSLGAAAKSRETTMAWKQQVSDGLAVWAAESLDKIANGSAMNIIIKLLKCTQSDDIQDLALYFITQLVVVSQEASEYIMQAPGTSDKKQGGGDKANAPVELTCLSHLLSLSAFYKNRYHVISGAAEIIITLITSLMSTTGDGEVPQAANDICLSIAKTPAATILPSAASGSSLGTPKLGGGDNMTQMPGANNVSSNNVLPSTDVAMAMSRTMSSGKPRKQDGAVKKPFLRGMNPFVGKDVAAMNAGVKKPSKFISIKSTDNPNVYSTKPILSALGVPGSARSGSNSVRAKSAKPSGRNGCMAGSGSARPTTADSGVRGGSGGQGPNKQALAPAATDAAGNPTIPWAGIKVFLKFLTRYSSYLQPLDAGLEPMDGKMNDSVSTMSPPKGAGGGIPGSGAAALTKRQQEELTHAIARVLTALSLLIINCPTVEEYVRDHCPGALAIYFHSVNALQRQFNSKLREEALRQANREENARQVVVQEYEGYTKNQVILTHLAHSTLQQQYGSHSKHVLSNNTYIQQCVKLLRRTRSPSPTSASVGPAPFLKSPAASSRGFVTSQIAKKSVSEATRPLAVSTEESAPTPTYTVRELHRPDSAHNAYLQQAQGFQHSSVPLAPVARGLSPVGRGPNEGPVLSNGKIGTYATGAAAAPPASKKIEKAYSPEQLVRNQYSLTSLNDRPKTSDGRVAQGSPSITNGGADYDHFEGDEMFHRSYQEKYRPNTAPGSCIAPGARAGPRKTGSPVRSRNSSSSCYKGKMKEPPVGKHMLHRNFFATLPVKPLLPETLSSQEILHRIVDVDKFDAPSEYSRVYVTNSTEKSEFVTKTKHKAKEVLGDLHKVGYMRDGKQSVPLEEKAGRVYGYNSLTAALERNLEYQKTLRAGKAPSASKREEMRRDQERQLHYQGPARPKTSPAMLTNGDDQGGSLAPGESNASLDDDDDFRFTVKSRDGVSSANNNADPTGNRYEQDIKFIDNDSMYSVTNRHMLSTTKTQTYNHKEQEFQDQVDRAVPPPAEEEAQLQARGNMNDVMLPGVLLEGMFMKPFLVYRGLVLALIACLSFRLFCRHWNY